MTIQGKDRHLQLVPANPDAAPVPRSGRRWLLANKLSALAIVATVGVLGNGVIRGIFSGSKGPNQNVPTRAAVLDTPSNAVTPTLSVDQLKAWPVTRTVVATPDIAAKGAGALGEEVDPQAYQGPNSNGTTAANLNDEIAGQDPSGFIHTDEPFKVPVINPNAPK